MAVEFNGTLVTLLPLVNLMLLLDQHKSHIADRSSVYVNQRSRTEGRAVITAVTCGLAGVCLTPLWRRAVRIHTKVTKYQPSALGTAVVLITVSVGVGWRFGVTSTWPVWWWLAMHSLLLAVIDWRSHKLPRFSLGAMASGGAAGFMATGILTHNVVDLSRALVASMSVWLMMRLVEWFCSGRMGGGDTRLHAVLALHTGWLSWNTVIFGILAGTVLVGMTAGTAFILGRRTWVERIAAAPGLLAGAWLMVLISA